MVEVAVVHSAPAGVAGQHWGDTHFAASLADALAATGAAARVVAFDERDTLARREAQVVVRGLHRHVPPRGGARSVLWVISHSDLVDDEELDAFDHVLVASSSEAARFRERTATPVDVLHQATDVRRFAPVGLRPTRTAHGVVVVANHRWPGRRGPRWLHELGIDYALYGEKWTGRPEAVHLVDRYVPNDLLAGVYSSAAVVVADQWTQMAAAGFVANRLFDVAAAGGFVLSDPGAGVTEVFGGLVPTYADAAELRREVERWTGHPAARRARSLQLHDLVVGGHTFDHRARTIGGLLHA